VTVKGEGIAAARAEDSAEPMRVAATPIERASLPVFHAIVTIGVFQALAMGFQLVRSKVVAVTLGPSGVGAISLVDHVAGLAAQISTFSLPFAAVKFLSAAHSQNHSNFASLFAALVRALLLVSVAGAAVTVGLLLGWPGLLGPDLSSYAGVAVLAVLAIPATNVFSLITNAMAAARRVRASAIYGAWNGAALAVLCAVGALLAGVRGYYLGNLAAMIAIVAGGLFYLNRREGLSVTRAGVSLLRELRRHPNVVGFAASLYVISFALPVAHLIARFAVLEAQGLDAAGLLQSAMALGLALATVMRQSNALLLVPAMNRTRPAEEKFLHAGDYLRVISIVVAIVAMPLVLFPQWWLPLLYSRQFLAAAPYAYLFVLAQTIQLFAGVNLALLVGLDHIGAQVWITLCGLAALALLAWSLVPHFGIAGVAIAMLFNGIVVFVLSSGYLWAAHRFVVHRAVGLLPFAMALLIAVAGEVAARLPSTPGIIVGKCLACSIVATVGLRILLRRDQPLLWSS